MILTLHKSLKSHKHTPVRINIANMNNLKWRSKSRHILFTSTVLLQTIKKVTKKRPFKKYKPQFIAQSLQETMGFGRSVCVNKCNRGHK